MTRASTAVVLLLSLLAIGCRTERAQETAALECTVACPEGGKSHRMAKCPNGQCPTLMCTGNTVTPVCP